MLSCLSMTLLRALPVAPVLLIALAVPAHSNAVFAARFPAAVADRGQASASVSIRGPVTIAAGTKLPVEFTLRNGNHARLVLMDVDGRILRAQHVGELGPGRHSVDLSNGQPLPPGLYFLRLKQGKHEADARAAVLR